MRRVYICLLVLLCVSSCFVAVILLRAIAIESPERIGPNRNGELTCDHINVSDEVVERFRAILRIDTVSFDNDTDRKRRNERLVNLRQLLKTSFPVVHSSSLVTVEVVSDYSLLYTVRGSDRTMEPYMLAAHLDVVPANEGNWHFPPFEARVDGGFIYARGAMDVKQNVGGILEALEHLLKSGFVPRRTFYVAFGHDEEVMGKEGARQIARVLQSRKVKLRFLLDEGLFITKGVVNFINAPVATIGVAEKGFVTLKLSVKSEPGHSSAPPPSTAIGILAGAISRLEANPHRNMFGSGVEVSMLQSLALHAPFRHKVLLANLWLFSPVVAWVMARDRIQNSFVRTTTAVTMFHGGTKSNVMPDSAFAMVNHRIHQVQTVAEVVDYDKLVINDDRVQVAIVDSSEPSPVSPSGPDTFGYQLLKAIVRNVHEDAVVVPSVLVASTDSKHYLRLTNEIYRFSPIVLAKEDLARFHGNNERISITNYEKTIDFYRCLIRNAESDVDSRASFTKLEL